MKDKVSISSRPVAVVERGSGTIKLNQFQKDTLPVVVIHQSFPAVPTFPPMGPTPGHEDFFENKPASAPRRGQTNCSNSLRYR